MLLARTNRAAESVSASSARYTISHRTLDLGGGRARSGTLEFETAFGGFGGANKTADGRISFEMGRAGLLIADDPLNLAPTFSALADQNGDGGTTPLVSFTVADLETPAGELRVSGSSSNPVLVPNSSIRLGGSGSNRNVQVLSAPGKTGTAVITLVLTDAAGGQTSTRFTVTVNVPAPKLIPEILWASPAPIVYGTLLGPLQLNATATVPGTFAYTPAAGTKLNAGDSTLSITFTPEDSENYQSATKTVLLTVTKAQATVTLGNLEQTHDGTPKSATATTVPAGLAVRFTYDGLTDPPSAAGPHAVVATVDDPNYAGSAAGTLTIKDTAPPVLTVPAPIVAGNDAGKCEAVVNFTVTAVDAASAVTVVSTPPSGTAFPVGTSTVTSVATDAFGNRSTAQFTVTVQDREAPVVLTKNITVPLDASGNASITPAQINHGSSDNCGIASLNLDVTSFTCAKVGPNTVTLTVTDVNGKSASATAVVTVTDVTKPSLVLNGPAEIILLQGNTYTELSATTLDQCDTTVPVVIGGDPVNTAAVGVYVVTYDAADDSGNAAPRVTRTVRVLPPFSIGNQLVGFKVVDLDEAAKVAGDIVSQEKLTHGVKTVVAGFARNVTGEAELKESALVNGNLEAGGAVTLNESAAVGSNVRSGGNVELKNKARVAGNVTASGKVTVHRGATVGGTVTEKAPKPIFQNVLLPELGLVPSRPDIEVKRDGRLSLPPGTYGKLDLKQAATLELAAGTYSFKQIDAALRATFKLDVRQGPLLVQVLGHVSAGQEVKFVPLAAAGDVAALKILMQTEGSRVNLDGKTEFVGTILAPEAVIDVGQQVKVVGALYGRRVQISANSTVAAAPAVTVLAGVSSAWLGYRNDCDGSGALSAGTFGHLARLIGQAVYGCEQVDLGASVVVAGNVASQRGVKLSASSRVAGNLLVVSGHADLGSSVEVTGSVEAGGRVDLAAQAKVAANVVSGGNVDLGTQAAVTGDVTAAGKVQLNRGAAVGGTVTQKAVVPPIPGFFLPTLGLRLPGGVVEIAKDGELSLPPGVYGEVLLKQNATLRLQAGTYRFDALDIGQKGRVELDLTGGSIVVKVVDTLDMDERTQMNAVAPAGASAAGRILFQVQGNRVKLGQNGVFLGTFMAPNAAIELRQESKLRGALFGESIRLGPKAEAQIEAATELMLTAALNWKVPAPGQGGNRGRGDDDNRDDGDDDDEGNNGNKGKQSPLPKLVQLRAPMMEISATREGLPVLRITRQAGFKGELQASDRLVGGPWEKLAELDGTTGVIEITDEVAPKATVRFYRIVTVEPLAEKPGKRLNEER